MCLGKSRAAYRACRPLHSPRDVPCCVSRRRPTGRTACTLVCGWVIGSRARTARTLARGWVTGPRATTSVSTAGLGRRASPGRRRDPADERSCRTPTQHSRLHLLCTPAHAAAAVARRRATAAAAVNVNPRLQGTRVSAVARGTTMATPAISHTGDRRDLIFVCFYRYDRPLRPLRPLRRVPYLRGR